MNAGTSLGGFTVDGGGLLASYDGSRLKVEYVGYKNAGNNDDPISAVASASGGGLGAVGQIDIMSQDLANKSIGEIDAALQIVENNGAKIGVAVSLITTSSNSLMDSAMRTKVSLSQIQDTDYSKATTELAKLSIIRQASQAMQAQASQSPQVILSLLKTVGDPSRKYSLFG